MVHRENQKELSCTLAMFGLLIVLLFAMMSMDQPVSKSEILPGAGLF